LPCAWAKAADVVAVALYPGLAGLFLEDPQPDSVTNAIDSSMTGTNCFLVKSSIRISWKRFMSLLLVVRVV
jgi:hypothetical protein